MEIIKKSFDYKSKIDYIIHISDIHIPLFKRQDEYKEVFNTLYEKIKTLKSNLKIKKNTNIPLIVVIIVAIVKQIIAMYEIHIIS